MFTDEQKKALQAPLSAKKVKERAQAGRKLSYIEGWHAIAEANRIFGFDAWDRETVELRGLGDPRQVDGKYRVAYMARVRIHVRAGAIEVVRDGCGYGSGIDRDLGQAHESAIKEAETDAMKRALMTFGNPFGLALYDKEQANVCEDEPAKVSDEDQRAEYMRLAEAAINEASDPEALRDWWKDEKDHRRINGLRQADVDDLMAILKTRIGELEDAREAA